MRLDSKHVRLGGLLKTVAVLAMTLSASLPAATLDIRRQSVHQLHVRNDRA